MIASIRELSRALANRGGERAASLYWRNSIEYYDRMVKAARTATRDEIAKMPWLDRLGMLVLRPRLPAADLRTLDGRQYIRRAVRDGHWTVEWGVEDYGGIHAQGSTAWMEVKKPDTRVRTAGRWRQRDMRKTHNVRFHLENDVWKLDETPLSNAWNEVLRDELNKSGTPEEAFLLGVAGIDPDDADRFWNPPKR